MTSNLQNKIQNYVANLDQNPFYNPNYPQQTPESLNFWQKYDASITSNSVKKAAVTIILFEMDNQIAIMFTKRSSRLRKHPGEVCFPGGKCDAFETFVQTALRETEEEIGLKSEFLTHLPEFSESFFVFASRFGILVQPQVFILSSKVVDFLVEKNVQFADKITPDFQPNPYFKISETEVESLFYLPLEQFLMPENLYQIAPWQPFPKQMPEIDLSLIWFEFSKIYPGTPIVWGLTGDLACITAIKIFQRLPEFDSEMYSDVLRPDFHWLDAVMAYAQVTWSS